MFVTKLTGTFQVSLSGRSNTALALDRLEYHRGGTRRNLSAQGFKVIERNVADAARGGLKAFLVFCLPADGHSKEGATVERTQGRNNFMLVWTEMHKGMATSEF